MQRQDEAEFTAFVDASSLRLRQIALLLVGDRGVADDLVDRALRHTRRSWTHLEDPLAYARGVVARRALVHRRGPDPASGMTGLDQLTPLQRTVLVLRSFDGLDDAAVAEALQLSETAVRTAVAGARARLRDVHLTEADRVLTGH